jgi:YHS domain-containing protein
MRLVIILFAIVVGFLLLRSLLAPLVNAVAALIAPSAQPPQSAGAGPKPAGELKKDPVCSVFISPDLAVTQKINGQVVHFCSEKCRDEYARTA